MSIHTISVHNNGITISSNCLTLATFPIFPKDMLIWKRTATSRGNPDFYEKNTIIVLLVQC